MSSHLNFQSYPNRRLVYLDAIRGFAMLGIMIVNFPSINTSAEMATIAYNFTDGAANEIVSFISLKFLNGKVYPIFSLLFGIGLYIFISNIKKSGKNYLKFTFRRLLYLILFGFIHVSLIWWGDILIIYGLLGLLVIPFFNRSKKILQYTILTLLVFFPISYIFFCLLLKYEFILPQFVLGTGINPLTDIDYLKEIYSQGTFIEITKQRFYDYFLVYTPFLYEDIYLKDLLSWIAYYSQILGMFLLGLLLAKQGIHQKIELLTVKLKLYAVYFLILTLIIETTLFFHKDFEMSFSALLSTSASLFYLCIITLLGIKSKIWQSLFAPVGKMSFTAYILHTFFFSLILYSYGLGLYGKVGPAILLPISIVFYFLVLCFSHFWLKSFKFGPLEWLWRTLIYWKNPVYQIIPK